MKNEEMKLAKMKSFQKRTESSFKSENLKRRLAMDEQPPQKRLVLPSTPMSKLQSGNTAVQPIQEYFGQYGANSHKTPLPDPPFVNARTAEPHAIIPSDDELEGDAVFSDHEVEENSSDFSEGEDAK
ncbi:hypothetical protein L596_010838 [Steinernema carpocapsae]|uniref:Uncharacterized protein n=1 Tax=Steinernema carpocapsae TaxID=34508 RepID=A0A4U5PJR4_STECR|nr:hypothetical protein L596_010838 [Steinernema carpocapsae]